MNLLRMLIVVSSVTFGISVAWAQGQKKDPAGSSEARQSRESVANLDLAAFNPNKTREPEVQSSALVELAKAYAITFGWAIVGSFSMGFGIILALKMTHWVHTEVDEWELIKQGNMPMAIIMAALILALGMVVASVTRIN
jgi:hypothetical protein